jgi:hypothetical protein
MDTTAPAKWNGFSSCGVSQSRGNNPCPQCGTSDYVGIDRQGRDSDATAILRSEFRLESPYNFGLTGLRKIPSALGKMMEILILTSLVSSPHACPISGDLLPSFGTKLSVISVEVDRLPLRHGGSLYRIVGKIVLVRALSFNRIQ